MRVPRPYLLLFLLFACARAAAAQWPAEDLAVTMGTSARATPGVTLTANAQGQVLVTVPARGLALDTHTRLRIHFGSAVPQRVFAIWHTQRSDAMRQKAFAIDREALTLDLAELPHWTGALESLQLGFMTAPGASFTLVSVELSPPGVADTVRDLLADWTEFRTWQAYDINVHTGTAEFGTGPHPVPLIGALALAALLGYALLARRRFAWHRAALIAFCAWLALDALWQLRLWQQLDITRERFAGLTPEEKLRASDDAPTYALAQQVKAAAGTPGARIFIASESDNLGMLSAYYLSPMNTYWRRFGHELPDPRYLRRGDLILRLNDSALAYRRGGDTLTTPAGSIAVRERVAGPLGVLLEVQ